MSKNNSLCLVINANFSNKRYKTQKNSYFWGGPKQCHTTLYHVKTGTHKCDKKEQRWRCIHSPSGVLI